MSGTGRPDPTRPERTLGAPVVTPRPAATVVLLRPTRAAEGAADGATLETLLTRRPAHMRFGGGIDVFPGGRIDPDDADAAAAAVRETLEETGIVIDRADLIPLTRWVTPLGLPSRFDVRFFAALVDAAAEVAVDSDEVDHWRWLTPARAIAGMRTGETTMWLPTVVTLQQLDGLRGRAAIEAAFAPLGPAGAFGPPRFEPRSATETLVHQPWAAGIEGRTAVARLVGRREIVIVDPADPTGETTEAVLAWAAARGAAIVGVAVTDLEPVHHAGVEMFAAGLGLPVVAGVGASDIVPYPVTELRPGDRVPFGDVELVAAAGERPRPESLRYLAT